MAKAAAGHEVSPFKEARPKALVIDVDGTLYDRALGLTAAINASVRQAFTEITGGRRREYSAELFHVLTRRHGTALLALHLEYGHPFDQLMAAVHDVDPKRFLSPAKDLRARLLRLPVQRILFSNAPARHIASVLHALDLSGVFHHVVAGEDCYPSAKPLRHAFDRLVELTDVGFADMLLFDDKIVVTQKATELGIQSVLITSGRTLAVDPRIPSFTTLCDALNEITASSSRAAHP